MPLFRSSEGVIGSPALDAFYIGRYHDRTTDRVGPKIQFPGTEPIIVIGRNRSGKDIAIGTYNALRLRGTSLFWFDPRGEAAAIAGPYRRTLGPTFFINPDELHTKIYPDLKSHKRNPLLGMDWGPRMFDEASGKAEAWIQIEGKEPHFERRARGNLALPLILWEVMQAAIEGRPPWVLNIRMLATEPDEFDPATGRLIKGLAVTARRMAAEGGPQIRSLISTFTGAASEEIAGARATFDGQSQWMLSPMIAADMDTAAGVDFRRLGEEPDLSCFFMMPQTMLETHAPYVRETISSALRALYKPSKTICTFWLNEFATLKRMEAIESALGMVAGNGIRLVFVVQSLTQLKLHYGDGWENFMAQAGAWILVGAPSDELTATYLSRRSGQRTIVQPNVGSNLNAGGGMGTSSGAGFTQIPYLSPGDLYGLPHSFGYVWTTGLDGAIPAYFPPYFDVDELNARAAQSLLQGLMQWTARKNSYWRWSVRRAPASAPMPSRSSMHCTRRNSRRDRCRTALPNLRKQSRKRQSSPHWSSDCRRRMNAGASCLSARKLF
jgi:type IV secretion system protein VirD4